MAFEIPPPPIDGSFDKWGAMRASEQWTVRATLRFAQPADPVQIAEFLDAKPDVPGVRFDSDFAARSIHLSFPPDSTATDVEIWIARVVGSGLFIVPGSA